MSEKSIIVETKQVSRFYPFVDGDNFYALKDVDVTIEEGNLTILRGRSGSGKTTLMNIIGALDKPSSGEVFFEGTSIVKLSEGKREELRRKKIGFIFQSVSLIPMMTAYENVEFALRLANYQGDRKARAEESLDKVGLAGRMNHMPQELSGGEQQRVAIARAICHRPKLVLADEPTAELDTHTSLQVMKIFKELIKDEKMTVVMTTHDVSLMGLGDRVYELEDGKICQ